jgi:drug/metabolite transporter (DMT)-like permease
VRAADAGELFTLAALWGGSFLFMRMGAAEFGPVALSAVRVAGATLLLLPLLQARGHFSALRRHWRSIMFVGVTNSALPFLCFSYAALSITAGLASIFNAATPLFGALIAWWWLKDKLSAARIFGLCVGFAGVLWLALNNLNQGSDFRAGGSGWAVLACIAATLLYGVSASFTKRHLTGVPPLAVATGSQLGATLFLLMPAIIWWPRSNPSGAAWLAALALALLCTGLAYVLYFRLIAHVGPANAMAVTFLIPAFAVLWGWIFLAEGVTLTMLLGCSVIVVGTMLATGLLTLRSAKA